MKHRMQTWIKTSVLSAAVAAVPFLLTSSAQAQQRIAADGHALDASNRLGSGGNNPDDSTKRVAAPLIGNDVVTGNVSGGKQFRGQVPYTDPRAFRGANGSDGVTSDNFIRSSSAAGPDARLATTAEPFYGSGRAVPPPDGYVNYTPGTGAFVPDASPLTRAPGDQRLGALHLDNPGVALPQPGEMFLAGQLDPTAGQTYILASPTAGIRTFGVNDINGFTSNTQYNPVGGRLDDASIQRMRDELNAAAGGLPDTSNNGAKLNSNNNAVPPTPAPNAIPGATPIIQQPVAQPNNAQPINNAVAAVPGGTSTDQASYNMMTKLPPPEQQSTAYATMLKQYQQSLNDKNMSDEDRARQYNNLQVQAKQDADKTAAAATAAPGAAPIPPAPGATPGAAPGATPSAPGGAAPAPGAAAATPGGTPDYTKLGDEILKQSVNGKTGAGLKHAQPIQVPSLAQGVKAKSISDYLKAAEQSMKDGKFTSAFDDYDKAELVAPNNPLIKLGRANAELGASYYARSEAHLHDAFTLHPELLVAQYDLTAMLGEQRLQTLVRDLKELSKKDPNEPRPLFLLSYIAYNTGHEQDAQAYLDLADKRSGGKDPFYKLLRDNWSLPTKPAATDANK